jgi:23S rRNA (pseudouridine1915-N3)-methyltransferase
VNVTLVCVGDTKGCAAEAVADYEARARRYWRFSVIEVEAGAGKAKKPDSRAVLAAEEARVLSRLPGGAEAVALTRAGKAMGSRAFAKFLQEKAVRSVSEVAFIIGGAYGLGEGVLARARLHLSLSKMTLPHEMARLVLAEQLYRAGTIVRNEPYHKGP